MSHNTPNLADKPEWANYWAQNEDGWCNWFEDHPYLIEADRGQGVWYRNTGQGKSAGKMAHDRDWAYSLVKIEGVNLRQVRVE